MESVLWGSSARYILKPQVGNPFAGRNKLRQKPQDIGNPFGRRKKLVVIKNKSALGEEVSLLMNDLNDKAYLYKSGKIDVIKNGNITVRKFPNMKAASLYLLKSGWQYVR